MYVLVTVDSHYRAKRLVIALDFNVVSLIIIAVCNIVARLNRK